MNCFDAFLVSANLALCAVNLWLVTKGHRGNLAAAAFSATAALVVVFVGVSR
jgi:hypothetical protein